MAQALSDSSVGTREGERVGPAPGPSAGSQMSSGTSGSGKPRARSQLK